MSTDTKEVEPKFAPLHVNAHGYDSPYFVKAFIEDESGTPVCGLYEGDGPHARLFAAAPSMYDACAALRARHRAKAKRANFDDCGCDDCISLDAALALVDGPQIEETNV